MKNEISDLTTDIQTLNAANISSRSLSGNQIKTLTGSLTASQLQSHIDQIQTARPANNVFDQTAIQGYAGAVQGLEASQAALLLSTQGLTNAQIAETLACTRATTAENYYAMADAGLLAQKQTLTVAKIQSTLQTVLGTGADTEAAMASLGLSAAIGAQEHQTVTLTSKKLEEAVSTHALTRAQAQELAMRTGVALSIKKTRN